MGIAESTLLLSRPLLWQGQVERASQLCESVNQSSGWIYGWLLRYRADILRGSMSPLEQWFLTLRDAWRANMGYLFQQKLLLARILTIDIKDTVGTLDPRTLRSLSLAACRAHRERFGLSQESCARCRGQGWMGAARHSFDVPGNTLPAFWR